MSPRGKFRRIIRNVTYSSLCVALVHPSPSMGALQQSQAATANERCGVEISKSAQPTTSSVHSIKWLDVVCGQSRTWIGAAQSFQAAFNSKAGVLVVVLNVPADTRILLIRQAGGGKPQISNITGEIANAAGRRASAPLGPLKVDLSQFEPQGIVRIPDARVGAGFTVSRGAGVVDAMVSVDLINLKAGDRWARQGSAKAQ